MIGMNVDTGAELAGFAHLEQSIRDILLTPKLSRVMLRDYGSDLLTLIDQPLNESTKMAIMAATVGALTTWEPRIQVQSVAVAADPASGSVSIHLTALYLPDGQTITIEGLKLS
jgi:phage baseplate assembly protein W